MAGRKTFSTAPVTAPSAGEPIPTTNVASLPRDVRPSRRRDAQTSGRPDVQTSAGEHEKPDTAPRTAFTWRLTPQEAYRLDTLVLQLRRQLGRGRLDKASVLLALVELAEKSDDVRAAVLGCLKTS